MLPEEVRMKLATRWGMAAVVSDPFVRRSPMWFIRVQVVGLAAKIALGLGEFSQKLFKVM
jgi:hypothetical protein